MSFKPNQSGNPLGRPRVRAAKTIIKEIWVKHREQLFDVVLADALSGNANSAISLIKMCDKDGSNK